MTPEILVTDTPGEVAYDTILWGIRTYNESQTGPGGHRLLAVLVKDEDGKPLGGLWGTTGWQWLFVHLLWLPEKLRGAGLGRDLLRRAEAEAVARGCGNVWLDTFSFQARGSTRSSAMPCSARWRDTCPATAATSCKSASVRRAPQ